MQGVTRIITYTYDTARRLTREQETGYRAITRSYTFDNRGNRTNMTVTGAENYTVTYTYDLNNRLLTETRTGSNPSTATLTYDRNGNQLTRTAGGQTETRVYNAFNQLTRVTSPGFTSTYTYRADGLRHSKTVNGARTYHVWDRGNIVLELNAAGAVINRFERGARGQLIRSQHHGFYLHDARGSVVQRVNAQGQILRNYRYTAFGNEISLDFNNTSPWRFNGMYWDNHRSEYMTPNRMFNPRTGRWTQPDPFFNIRNGNLQGSPNTMTQAGNLYMFVMHNPVNFTDPSGLFAIPFCALFNPIAKAAKKLVAKLTNKPAVQNTAQQASQTVQQTQQVTQAARGSVLAAQQAAAPLTRYAPQATQQVTQTAQQAAPRVQQAAPAAQQAAPRVQQAAQQVTPRVQMLNTVQNPQLTNVVNQLYRANARIGDGGTADMLRHEIQTGQALRHLQKAQDYIRSLEKILKSQDLSSADSRIAHDLLSDLLDAVTRVVQ